MHPNRSKHTKMRKLVIVIAPQITRYRTQPEHLQTFLERVARRVRGVGLARHDDDLAMLAVRRLE